MGKAQTIRFSISDSVLLNTSPINLRGSSSEGLPVMYYVKYGPAEIKNNQLMFTSIPPKTKYPVKVVVVAYQWGRSIAPQVQTAVPVEQTFYIQSDKKLNLKNEK